MHQVKAKTVETYEQVTGAHLFINCGSFITTRGVSIFSNHTLQATSPIMYVS